MIQDKTVSYGTKIERLWAALATVLDQVDYTSGACTLTEMVGAVLPVEVINMARNALKECEPDAKGR